MAGRTYVNSNFTLHATGIWPAVCVDVINLGLVWTEFQGKRKLVRKVKLVFETEHVGEDGKRGIVTKNFTASVHPKAKLAEFLGKWRGRPVVPGENIDLKKVLGVSCTLVLCLPRQASASVLSRRTAKTATLRSVLTRRTADNAGAAGTPGQRDRHPVASRAPASLPHAAR